MLYCSLPKLFSHQMPVSLKDLILYGIHTSSHVTSSKSVLTYVGFNPYCVLCDMASLKMSFLPGAKFVCAQQINKLMTVIWGVCSPQSLTIVTFEMIYLHYLCNEYFLFTHLFILLAHGEGRRGMPWRACGSQGTTQEQVLCFHCVGPRGQTQVLRLGGRRLHPLSPLISSTPTLFQSSSSVTRNSVVEAQEGPTSLFPTSWTLPFRHSDLLLCGPQSYGSL